MTNGGRIPWSADAFCEKQDLLSDGKTIIELRFGEPFGGPIIPVWFDRKTLYFCQRLVATPSVWQESVTMNILRLCIFAGGIWKVDILIADIHFFNLDRRWNSQIIWSGSCSEKMLPA